MIRWLCMVVVMLVASTASAHPLDIGYLRIESQGTVVKIEFDLEQSVAGDLLGIPKDKLDASTVSARMVDFANVTYKLAPISTNAGPCVWKDMGIALRPSNILGQTAKAECPLGSTTIRWDLPVIAKMPSTFELLVKSYAFGGEHVAVVKPSNPRLDLEAATQYGFVDLIVSGVEHIGAAPNQWHDESGFKLADGIDHVLFLLALLIAGGTLLQLIGIATGFTVGHSVTLGLGTFGLVEISPSIIEPLVALTIAIAAVEAIVGKYTEHRWKIATLFGFIHGFAFAGALGELQLATSSKAAALFGFNLGVELGQIIVIVLVAPGIILLHRKRPDVAKVVVRVVGGVIFLAGLYWFVERTFL